eukprot:37808-Eustigmatos_ZCMA.PRE.1
MAFPISGCSCATCHCIITRWRHAFGALRTHRQERDLVTLCLPDVGRMSGATRHEPKQQRNTKAPHRAHHVASLNRSVR